MLQQLLNSHPSCRCFFELFHRHKSSIAFGVKGYRKRSADPKYVKLRNDDPVGFLEQVIYQKQPRHIQAVGFKLLYPQCRKGAQFWDEPEYAFWWKEAGIEPKWNEGREYLWDFLAREKIHIIHLLRENQLARKVSGLLAQKTGKWGVGATGGFQVAPISAKIYIDPREYELDLRGEEHFRSEVRTRFPGNPFIETTYEKLITEKQTEHSRLLDFLALPQRPLNTPTRVQRSNSVEDIVENYQELVR